MTVSLRRALLGACLASLFGFLVGCDQQAEKPVPVPVPAAAPATDQKADPTAKSTPQPGTGSDSGAYDSTKSGPKS